MCVRLLVTFNSAQILSGFDDQSNNQSKQKKKSLEEMHNSLEMLGKRQQWGLLVRTHWVDSSVSLFVYVKEVTVGIRSDFVVSKGQ